MKKGIKIVVITAFLLLSLISISAVSAGNYSTAMNNTNPGAPDPGIPGFVGPDGDGKTGGNNYVNPAFVEWASTVIDYSPANQTIQPQWTDATKALGPVTGNNLDIVSLGDLNADQLQAGQQPGSITLGFNKPIANGPGADFAVFENSFLQGGAADKTFAELAYVEVSTDGINFVRFPSVSLTPGPVGGYGTIDSTDVYNLAGKHVNAYGDSWGTPFDLANLENMTEVISGLVNINNINYVKIVDIPGNGFFNDSLGNPIYDAWLTWGSGGLDLEAVGVIHTADTPLGPVVNERTGLIYNTIQEAIDDSLTVNGDIINVYQGDFQENVIVNKSLLLRALGSVNVVPVNVLLPVFTVNSNGNGSIIQGFIINGTATGILLNGTSNNLFQNNTIIANQNSAATYGVHLLDANNNQICGNTINTTGDTITYGVYLDNSDSNLFDSNTINTTGRASNEDWSDYLDGAIYSTIGVFISNASSNNNLTDNIINTDYNTVKRSCSDTIVGVQIRKGCDGNRIIGNTIDTNGYSYTYGLEVIGGYETESTDNIISDNIISTVGDSIYANGVKVGAYTYNSIISGNNISATAPDIAYGIYLENFTGYLRSVTVTGNTVNTQANINYIIELYAAIGSRLANGNTITNNVLIGVGNYTMGIATIGSRYNTIANNTINITGDNSAEHISNQDSIPESNTGIKIYNHSRYNIVSNNTINGSIVADTSGSTSSSGVHLYKSTYNTLEGNTINGSFTNGIYLENASNSNDIANNNVSIDNRDENDNSYGICLSASNSNNIEDNNVTTNGDMITYGVYLNNSSSNVIDSNTINTTGLAGDVDWSDYMDGAIYSTLGVFISNASSNNNLTDNIINIDYDTVSGSGYDTIVGVQIRKGCDGNRIIGNTIDTNGYSYTYGLEVVGGYETESTDNIISDNIISTVGDSIYANGVKVGAYTYNSIISGNNISATAPDIAYGIYLENFTGYLRSVTVTGNTVNTQANINYIIELYVASGSSLANGNTITNNVLIGVGNYTMGIATFGSRYNTIANNTINITGDNSAEHISNPDSIPESNTGIKIYNHSRYNIVSNNTINGSIVADTSGSTSSSGVHLYKSTYNTLEGNTINGSFTNGIYLENASNSNDIANNNVSIDNRDENDNSYGICLSASNSNNIEDNNVTTNGDMITYGVYLENSSSNVFDSNVVNTTGASATVDWSDYLNIAKYSTIGFFISDHSNNNQLTNNTINTSYDAIIGDHDTLLGVRIHKGSGNNNLTGNTITTTGYSYAYGLEIVGAQDETFTPILSSGNVVSNNTINTVGIRDHVEQSYANGVKVSSYTSDTLVSGNNISAVAPHFSYTVFLEDFGYGYQYYLGPSTVTGNNVYGAAHIVNLVELWCTQNQTITGNMITGVGNYTMGVGTYMSSYNNITNNTINITGDNSATIGPNVDAIPAGNDGIKFYQNSNNNIVSNNTINGSIVADTSGSTSSSGVHLYKSTYNTLEGNTINGSFTNGIYLENASNSNDIANNNVSIDNRDENDNSYGICLSASNSNNIEDNNVTTNGDMITYGVYLNNSSSNVIDSNTINTTGLAGDVDWLPYPNPGIYSTLGVFLFNGSKNNNVTGNNIITDYNEVSGTGYDTMLGVRLCQNSNSNNIIGNQINTTGSAYSYGLEIVGGSDSVCSGNMVSGNTINTIGDNYANGVKVSGHTKDTILSGNTIIADALNFSYGVYLENFEGLENVTVTENNITSTANKNYVLDLYCASGHTITNNLLNGDGEQLSYGIHLFGESNSNTFSGNIVTTHGDGDTYGVYLENSSSNVFDSNVVNTTGASATVDWSDYLNGGKYRTIGFFMFDHSNNNQLTNNTINTSYDAIIGDHDTLLGVRIHKGSSNNNLTGNTITTTGYSYAYGLEIVGAQDETFTPILSSGNVVSNNTINTVGIRDHVEQSYANGVKVSSYTSDTLVSGNNISAVAPHFSYPVYLEDFGFGYQYYLGPSTVTGNNVYGAAHIIYLLQLWCTQNQTITGNIFTGVGNYTMGVGTYMSSYNNITNNTINITGDNSATIGPNVDAIPAGNDGIKFYQDSNNNIVDSNIIIGNGSANSGVYVHGSDGNTITNNIISDNEGDGVYMGNGSDNNTLTGNTISSCGYGVRIKSSVGNSVHHNNFNSNNEHTFDDSTSSTNNSWDDGSTGNYYDNWITTNPRPVAGGLSVDNHPSLAPF